MSPPEQQNEYLPLQTRFADALSDYAKSAAATAQFAGDAAIVDRKLALYRGNVLAARAKALRAAYPIVEQIVGEDFFLALTRRYMQTHPSDSGDLNQFGEQLAEFLRDFEETAGLPYLPDVAALEWAVHRAHYAADSTALQLETLANTAPEHQIHLRFEFQPAVVLMRSDYPVGRIWEVHQKSYRGEFEVAFEEKVYFALVHRPMWRVEVDSIDAGMYAFLRALQGGALLGEALESALEQDTSFDLGGVLAKAVEWKLFSACNVGEPK